MVTELLKAIHHQGQCFAGLFVRDAKEHIAKLVLYFLTQLHLVGQGGVSSSFSIFVDRGSNETITGAKTFSSLTGSVVSW